MAQNLLPYLDLDTLVNLEIEDLVSLQLNPTSDQRASSAIIVSSRDFNTLGGSVANVTFQNRSIGGVANTQKVRNSKVSSFTKTGVANSITSTLDTINKESQGAVYLTSKATRSG